MSTERYPHDLIITVDDFRNSNWREAIENAGEHGYSSYWDSFSKAARHGYGRWGHSEGKSSVASC